MTEYQTHLRENEGHRRQLSSPEFCGYQSSFVKAGLVCACPCFCPFLSAHVPAHDCRPVLVGYQQNSQEPIFVEPLGVRLFRGQFWNFWELHMADVRSANVSTETRMATGLAGFSFLAIQMNANALI